MVKKLLVVLALVVCAAFVYQANAGVIVGNPTRAYWRENGGADKNDGKVDVVPGENIFVQIWSNSPYWGAGLGSSYIRLSWDTAVVSAVSTEREPYEHFADYRGTWRSESSGADFNQVNYGLSNHYYFPGGGDTGGAPVGVLFDYAGTYGTGGLLSGYYITVSPTAPMGVSYVPVTVRGYGMFGGGFAVTLDGSTYPEWALALNVIPEPATMSLLAIGGVLALIRRKK